MSYYERHPLKSRPPEDMAEQKYQVWLQNINGNDVLMFGDRKKGIAITYDELIAKLYSNQFLCPLMFEIAKSLEHFPSACKAMHSLYKKDRLRFYSSIKDNNLLNTIFWQYQRIEVGASIRRNFSILYTSLSDDIVAEKVIHIMKKAIPDLRKLDRNSLESNPDIINEIRQKYIKKLSTASSISTQFNAGAIDLFSIYIMLFELRLSHGNLKMCNLHLGTLYFHYVLISKKQRNSSIVRQGYRDFGDFDYYKSGMAIVSPISKALTKEISTGDDFVLLSEISNELPASIDRMEKAQGEPYSRSERVHQFNKLFEQLNIIMSDVIAITEHRRKIMELLMNAAQEKRDDIYAAIHIAGLLSGVLDYYGIDADQLFSAISLSPDEKNAILILSESVKCYFQDDQKADSFADFIVGCAFALFAKIIRSSSDFYFANDAESTFSEFELAQARIRELEQQNRDLQRSISELNTLVSKQESELKKYRTNDKLIAVSHIEENQKLKSKNEQLQAELTAAKGKNLEVDRLRELAFELCHEYHPVPKKTLSELIQGNNIVILGGHENWRTKVKEKYPQIRIIDGHALNFDINIIRNADIVLLFTGNMEHSAYYKVIDVLRSGVTDFDYLGRTINQDLLEDEMADILEKHGFGAE